MTDGRGVAAHAHGHTRLLPMPKWFCKTVKRRVAHGKFKTLFVCFVSLKGLLHFNSPKSIVQTHKKWNQPFFLWPSFSEKDDQMRAVEEQAQISLILWLKVTIHRALLFHGYEESCYGFRSHLHFAFDCACVCLVVQSCLTPWDPADYSPPSFSGCGILHGNFQYSRQEYWSQSLLCSPMDLPNPGIKPISPRSLTLANGFFTTSTNWEALSFELVFVIITVRKRSYIFLTHK